MENELNNEIKVDVPDIETVKVAMFNVWRSIFSKIDTKNISNKLLTDEDVEIIKKLVEKMQFSQAPERKKICKNLGYDPRGGSDWQKIKERIYLLVTRLKEKKAVNPNVKIDYIMTGELNKIAKEFEAKEFEEKDKVKTFEK